MGGIAIFRQRNTLITNIVIIIIAHQLPNLSLLVSDVIYTGNNAWKANQGITLPDNTNATHNIALSPLLFGHNGALFASATEPALADRGQSIYFWSANSWGPNGARFLWLYVWYIYPSTPNNRFLANSLRCLVSTTNS